MKKQNVIPLQAFPLEICKKIHYFFTDIDDTITQNGMLPPDAYNALWDLYENDINVIPVTGRPAGWCDLIARFWPVTGVIGENGAFYFSYNREKKKMKRYYQQNSEQRNLNRKKLNFIRDRILREVPKSKVAADQEYRISDLAIDYKEDTCEPLSEKEIMHICNILNEHDTTFKISSIHINAWFGDFNKLSCVHAFMKTLTGKDFGALQEEMIYIGDSPNDEPLFKAFRYSIAVANIDIFLAQMKHHPKYVTKHNSAKGFCEAVYFLLNNKNRT